MDTLLRPFRPIAAALSAALVGLGCTTLTDREPIRTEAYVDLERFMGLWYVIAAIPTFIEDEAYNATEHYRLDDDGTVATTFRFRDGGFDGQERVYTPRGFVRDKGSNAVWGMRFVWPIKADYRIVEVDEDYTQTIIGRNKRDYVWIMARTPTLPADDYERLVGIVRAEGYDVSALRKVPQRWPD